MTMQRQPAQALVFLTAMLPLFLAVIGLALDGGHLFAERANLQAIADAPWSRCLRHSEIRDVYRPSRRNSAPLPSRSSRSYSVRIRSLYCGV
jgi:hypothetical protein